MASHENLVFFNKEGDYLNFNYNEIAEVFEGDLLFHENSTDTFKTIGVYMLDKISEFEFWADGDSDLETIKFQLFNEYGMHFYGSVYENEKILNIELTNTDPNFYSKWIYGNNFQFKYPVGTIVQFVSTNGFNDHDIFVVVDTKKDAFMVLSTNNNTIPYTFTGGYVSGVNAFGINDYIDFSGITASHNLSSWNEPNYYTRLFEGRKINIINSKYNDGIYTIKGSQSYDLERYIYSLSENDVTSATSSIIMEVVTRTDVPKIYDNSINIDTSINKHKINIFGEYPSILTSFREFKIVDINDDTFYTVQYIPLWEEYVNITYFNSEDQVIYNGKIYECNTGYTHSFDYTTYSTAYDTPENLSEWGNPTHIKTNEELQITYTGPVELYLTTDHFLFEQEFLTHSAEITILSLMNRYSEEISLFNIYHDYDESNNTLNIISEYPSKYIEVNFYENNTDTQIGTSSVIYENIHFVEETLKLDLDKNYSERYENNIIIDNIDSYGLKIQINGMLYEAETQFVKVNGVVDVVRTIDRTLRNWISRNYLELYRLGIDADIRYTGNGNSLFTNSIFLRSHYPNVQMIIEKILMGDNGLYHIEHSTVIFEYIGPYLTIEINDTDYGIPYDTDISTTLSKWIDSYAETLKLNNILVENVSNLLKFNILNTNKELNYIIKINELELPGIDGYYIKNKYKGNHGALITSNEIFLDNIYGTVSSHNFSNSDFSVGMALSMNNTYWIWMNQEYNILQFTDDMIIYNYQGPYWNTLDTPDLIGGEFDINEFNTAFFLNYEDDNQYDSITYSLTTTDTLIDLIYLQLSDSVYVLSEGYMTVMDSDTGIEIESIQLNDNTYKKMIFNYYDNMIYLISDVKFTVFNPVTYGFNDVTLISANPIIDMEINQMNGNVFISISNDPIEMYDGNNTIQLLQNGYNMTYDMVHHVIYAIRDTTSVIKIDGFGNITSYTNTIYPYLNNLDSDIIYYDINDNSLLLYDGFDLIKFKFNSQAAEFMKPMGKPSDFIYNPVNNTNNISADDSNYYILDSNNNIETINMSGYGYLAFNSYDMDIYLSRGNNSVIAMKNELDTGVNDISKMEYNPTRKSIWSIKIGTSEIIEIKVMVSVEIQPMPQSTNISDNSYGTLNPNFVNTNEIYIKTRDFVKTPKENFIGEQRVQYYWKWFDDTVESFFFYDFSGDQLDIIDQGSYSYQGVRPLPNVVLNKKPNRDVNKIKIPEWQQTVFDRIWFNIPYLDETTDRTMNVSPLELFIGYQSTMEGTDINVLQLYKREEIYIHFNSDINNEIKFNTIETAINGVYDRYGIIEITNNSNFNFHGKGLKANQLISINFKDITNNLNQYVSDNEDSVFKIRYVGYKEIILDFIKDSDILYEESTIIENYVNKNDTTYLRFSITVLDKEIGRFNVYGQTEDEDERFEIELGNVGKLIEPDDVFIFKDYDILEGGMDWKFMNIKRKEMLMMKHLIYPYIGAYKSIINAINYFGYGDLQLNEYYRNININSPLYDRLHKVEIPKIFDNQYDGWEENDFIKDTYPNENYEETNLFNLTYFITDKDGNNILHYSLDEVIIKLQGLKYWLKRNIIPLTHKILDITGMLYFKPLNYILHRTHDVKTFNMYQNLTPITFKLNEAYLNPVNSGSTVYTCVLDFYSIIPGVGHEPILMNKPLPFNGVEIELPDYFDIKIRTYKTYLEWEPFKIYNKGDQVKYYNRLYESVIDNNRIKNPRKYEGSIDWSPDVEYEEATIVKYRRDYYVYIGTTQSSSDTTPAISLDWDNITEWKEIDYVAVQTISEYRKGDNLLPFSFTIDSNIDPFITIDVTCDNGYGEIWGDRRSYEIRGLNDFGKSSIREMDLPIEPTPPLPPEPEILPTISTIVIQTCGSYTWSSGDGNTYHESGTHSYTVGNNTYILDLTIGEETIETINETVCESYTWTSGNGVTYTESGTYTWITTNENGCPHTAILNLTILNKTSETISETACGEYTWMDGDGNTYTESGQYVWTTVDENNCEKILILDLTINETTSETITVSSCGDYTWVDGNGQTYNDTGTYLWETTNDNGCSHSVTLDLTVIRNAPQVVNITTCDESYTWNDGNGQTYTENGSYVWVAENMEGCTYSVTLNLTFSEATSETVTVETCDEFIWSSGDGETYTQSGTYLWETFNENGCTHSVTLDLTLNRSSTHEYNDSACDEYLWMVNNETYTQSGVYTHNTECESHILTLTINESDSEERYVTHNFTSEGPYLWDVTGETYSESGTYTHTETGENGCLDVYTLYLTITKSDGF